MCAFKLLYTKQIWESFIIYYDIPDEVTMTSVLRTHNIAGHSKLAGDSL